MGFDTIHETSIKDITDTILHGINTASDAVFKGKNKNDITKAASLTKATKGLIMQFPVLVSKANHVESAAIVAKAYEAKFVTLLQMAFAACNITSEGGLEFIRNFHTNLDSDKITVDEFIDIMDSYAEGANLSADTYAKYRAVTEDMKNLAHYFDDDINESSLNSYKVFKAYNTTRILKEDNKNLFDDLTDDAVNAERKTKEQDNKDQKDARDAENLGLNKNKDERDARNMQRDIFTHYLVPQEIKKMNELTPTMIIVNFVHKETPKSEAVNQQLVIGVKAKVYEVEPMDVINKLISKYVDGNFMLKLIKVNTREISFVKDFLLAIDSAKLDALSRSKRGSTNKLFKVLERRALNGKIRKALKGNNYHKAISSLVISQEEAEELMKNNIDVMNPAVIRPIMEKLNLISFAVIDESSEAVKFIFDTGDDIYETIPFSKLEKEQRDGMSKKVINLLAKVNR